MKVYAGILGATILAALMATGCTETAGQYRAADLKPAIMLDGPRQVSIGETQRIIAHTQDTAGARSIQWTVEPSTAKVTPENNTAGQSAMFSANQRGRYIVTARTDMGNGQAPVESSTTIDVVGGPTASERMNEPAPRQ